MHVQKTTFGNPVDIPRRFNVYATSLTSYRRLIDIETTSCVYQEQTAGRANILCKYIIYILFQFWAWFLRFPFYVEKVQLVKKIEIIFAGLYFYLYELKKCVSNFCNLLSNWRYQYFCPLWCLFQQICSTKKLLF